MADGDPGVVPMLAYADGPAAMEWLCVAFGFRERRRMMDGDRLTHGVLDTEFGRVTAGQGRRPRSMVVHKRSNAASQSSTNPIPISSIDTQP